jgi:non-lysosomal glucosylceramidase
MSEHGPDRRDFLKSLSIASSAALPILGQQSSASSARHPGAPHQQLSTVAYPRIFTGPALKMISFPLGGIGAGSIGLGGRGQLRDWEICNRADQGNSPQYSFASIWVQAPGSEPVAHVLESRLEPPYEGQDGLGSKNAPGLSRLQGATFTGEFPLARVDFDDTRLPLKVSLEAGTPFIPLDADASGLPLAALRYRVTNTAHARIGVAIAFSVENPVKSSDSPGKQQDARVNDLRNSQSVRGILMHNPGLAANDPLNGTFALAVLNARAATFTALRGWPSGRWWNSPLLFWDDFSADGELGPEPANIGPVGAVCLKRELPPGGQADFCFLLSWHFPNRTPQRCGWESPKGHEQTIIGNWYATKFSDAWAVAEYASTNLEELQQRTRRFAAAIREATLPAPIKEACTANLSTLVSTTCFRTADGEFHAFEGSDDHSGCCFGNCTHVWNYETATAHLFPSLSQSLRRSAFGYSMDERGGMHFRQLLPDGIERYNTVAADGQMGQIMKVFIDWQLSGDKSFLLEFWPKVKRAIGFAWIPGGWDANRDGVLEGVQHNTYDVEFYGPNPLCGIYYLGALRAAEEMARAASDNESADQYRRLFESGKHWLDANLFNGAFYVQRITGRPAADIAAGLRSGMGADDPEHPQYQVGDGCLVDQLIGQYLADVAALGPLLDPARIRKTLESVYRYNHKPDLQDHDCVERTFALNDEAAMVICDYPNGKRPTIPFPYYAEVMTGFEYSTAALMLFNGMIEEGVECIHDIRRRYDGIRRNPWDEAECGHHYARAMASWSGLLALSGFLYRGAARQVTIAPRWKHAAFRSFWSTATAWGTFSLSSGGLSLEVTEGALPLRELSFLAHGSATSNARLANQEPRHTVHLEQDRVTFIFSQDLIVRPGQSLVFRLA